jgi:S1-C subfamily serine protease
MIAQKITVLVLPLMVALSCSRATTEGRASSSTPGSGQRDLREMVARAKAGTVSVLLNLEIPQGGAPPAHLTLVNGSGVAVSPDRVLTCDHVIFPPATAFPPGTTILSVSITKDSEWSENSTQQRTFPASLRQHDGQHDLALLDVAGLGATPLSLAAADDVDVGDDVFFIGHPADAAVFSPAVGTAIIAAKEVTANGNRVFRLDGSVNHGNSGGALISRATGRLAGIVNAKAGGFTADLQLFLNRRPTASISIGGDDPIALVKQTLTEMEKNLQLGIGYAIRVDEIQAFLARN